MPTMNHASRSCRVLPLLLKGQQDSLRGIMQYV
jgi:hypothetical protein